MPSLKYHTLPCSPCSERCQGSEANEVFLPEAFLGNNHGAVARAAFQVGSACRNLQPCRALVLPAPRRGSRRAGSPQLPIVPSSGHPAREALLAPLIFRLISASVSLLLDWHDYFFLLFSFCCTWQEMQSLSRATRGGRDCYPAMQAVASACFSTRAFLAWSPSFLG